MTHDLRARIRGLPHWVALVSIAVGTSSCSCIARSKQGKRNAESAGIPYRAVIAHRGASWKAPEGTRAAYELACAMGVDYLEGDLRRTKDGHLVVLHDRTLKRTTNVEAAFPDRQDQGVEAFTLAELNQLDAGSWFNEENPDRADARFRGERLLTLAELMAIAEAAEPRPGLYLEVKSPARFPGIESQLVDLLRRRGWIAAVGEAPPAQASPQPRSIGRSPVILQSFSLESIAAFERLAPDVPRVYLVGDDAKARGWDSVLADATRHGAGLGISGYDVNLFRTGRIHRQGLYLHVYTINESRHFRILTWLGADGFFTDRPHELLRFYGRRRDAQPDK